MLKLEQALNKSKLCIKFERNWEINDGLRNPQVHVQTDHKDWAFGRQHGYLVPRTKDIFKLGPEFDKSNAYMKFGRHWVIRD